MLLDIIYLFLPIIIFVVLFIKYYNDFADEFENSNKVKKLFQKLGVATLFSFLILICYLVMSLILGMLVVEVLDSKETLIYEQNIVSLKGEDNISGSFVLGTGYIGTSSHYIYYTKKDDEGYLKDRVDAYNVTLYETNNIEPKYVETIEIIRCNNPLIVPKYTKIIFLSRMECNTVRKSYNKKLYVPENTIIKEFKLE